MSGFLEPADIKRLTGYRQRKRQLERLAELGIPCLPDKNGDPIVAWADVRGGREHAEQQIMEALSRAS